MNWERTLDIVIAVLVVALIHFIFQLFEVIETTALRGAEAPRGIPTAKSVEKPWDRNPNNWRPIPRVEPTADTARSSN